MEGSPAPSEPRESRPPEYYLPSIEALLKQIIQHAGFNLTVSIRRHQPSPDDVEAPDHVVDFAGPDCGLLVESNGALLDALEYVTRKAVRMEDELLARIMFDAEDWRLLRVRELQLTAQLAAERVMETGDPYPLGPMNPRDRRIIHLALKNQSQVRTESQGFGHERKVVIHPATAPSPRRR